MNKKVFFFFLAFFTIFGFINAANKGDILITEFAPSSSPDYVEIQNVSGGSIDVNGWMLTDLDGTDSAFVSSAATLADGDIAVIRWTAGTSETDAGGGKGVNGYWDFYCADTALTATDDQGVLKDNLSNIIDAVDWTNNDGSRVAAEITDAQSLVSAGQWTGAGDQADAVVYGSIAERNDANDTDSKNDWTGSTGGSLGIGNIGYSGGSDTTPPQVSSTTPNSGATSVSLSQDIIIVFDEAMNTANAESSFSINPDVTGKTFSWNGVNTQMTVVHDNFASNTDYTVTISTAATDVAGNQLDGDKNGTEGPDYVFPFKTQAVDGSGTCSVNPTSAENGVNYNFDFTFTANADLTGGQVEITIPANWTAPQSTNSNQNGYISITGGSGTVSINGISGSGPWQVLIDTTTLANGQDFIFSYGGTQGSSCSVDGNYTFTTKSKGSGGTLTAIGTSPTVNVYTPGAGDGSGTASKNYQDNDPIYAGGIGNYVYINYTPSSSYDIYKVSMTVPANWSAPTKFLTDILEDGTTYLSKDTTYFSISGQEVIYNYYELNDTPLTSSHYLQFKFKAIESSPNTTDNGFVVKSSASDPSTPGELTATSPVTVNMTATKWYTAYFNDSVDQAYAATTNLQATSVGKNIGSGLDKKLNDNINQATTYINGAFYTGGLQSIEDALKNGNFSSFRWWTEKYYWNSENNFHSDLETKYGTGAVRNDADDGSGDTGLSHNKFIVMDYNATGSPVENLLMAGSWNISNNGTTNNAQNVIFFQDTATHPVAELYVQEMDEFWAGRSGSGKTYAGAGTRYHLFSVGGGKKVQFGRANDNVEAYMAPNDDVHSKIITAINSANSSIYFCVFTFTASDIYTAIKNRWLSGVTVEGVFDSFQAGSSYSKYSDMVADGIPVKKDCVSGLLHHKYLIIDEDRTYSDPIVVTGSANWTNATDTSGANDENTIIIHDANLANEFYQEFRARYGASSNITPADASIIPQTCSTNQVKTITVTAKHNDSTTDNIIKVHIFVPGTWTPAPSSSNTYVKRNDGTYYSLSSDVNFNSVTGGTWVELTCPTETEILSSANGGTDANGKNSVNFVFTDFTSPGTAGPTVFTTKVDWNSNPNSPELTETSPSPVINIMAGVVVVNEVYFRGNADTDWLELYCADGGPINIQNWYLTRFSDSDSPNGKIKLIPDITLANGDFVLVHWDSTGGTSDENNGTGKGDAKWDVYTKQGQIIATDEQVVLKDNQDRYVDSVGWAEHGDSTFRTGETDAFTLLINNNQWKDYAVVGTVETTDFLNSDLLDPVAKAGYSFARKADGFDNNEKEDWVLEASPTPGSGNANLPVIVINEVGYYGTSAGNNFFRGVELDFDWVEIYCIDDTNNGSGIDIGGYKIDETNSGSGDHIVIPANTIIKTGEYLMLMGIAGTNDASAQVIDKAIAIYKSTFDMKNTHESYLTFSDDASHILDFVSWSNYDCSNNFYAITDFDTAQEQGEWKDYPPDGSCVAGSQTTDDYQIDSVNADAYSTNDTLGRNNQSTDTNDKVDWQQFTNGNTTTPGMPNCTPTPSGKMFASPNKVRPTTVYDFLFTFETASEPIDMYYVVIPSTWGNPNGWTINLLGTDGGSYTVGTYGASSGGGTAIWVNGFTGGYLETGATSALKFTNITSPATLGSYTYYAGSEIVGGFPYELANSPVITVLDGILLITEVHFANHSSDNFWENHDWAEIYAKDVGGSGIDISGFKMTDLDGTDTAFAGSAVTLHTGDYVIVHWMAGTDETDSTGDTNGNGYIDLYCDDTGLTATDDECALVSGTDVYYDAVFWANNDGTFSESGDVQILVDKGQWMIRSGSPSQWDGLNSKFFDYTDSLVRVNTDSDSDNLYDWARTKTQSPGVANLLDCDGTGVMMVTDTNVGQNYAITSSYQILTSGTKWEFMFVPQSPISEGEVRLNILPTVDDWTTPTAGMISISKGAGVELGTFSVSGNKIVVPVVSMSQNDTFTITYGKNNDVTLGTRVENFFPIGTKITGSNIVWTEEWTSPQVDLQPLSGDHIEVSGPWTNGMMVGDSVTFTIKLVDQYGNKAASTDANATCGIQLDIDDFVADNSEDINTATLTGASNISGLNDTTVTGDLVGSSATVKLIDYEPSSGQTPRTLRITAIDKPVVLAGSSTWTKDVTVYPPLSVNDAYTVYTSSSNKYKAINVEFTAPFSSSTLGDTVNYSLKKSGVTEIYVSNFYPLTGNKVLRVIPAEDLIPGETYTITVYNQINDGLSAGTTIVAPFDATFTVPYESGINISATEINNFDQTSIAGGKYNLFPVWNPAGTKVAYVSNANDVCNIYTLDTSDTTNSPVQITLNTENVLYFSQICWADDGYLYYATYTSPANHSRLFRRLDDGTGSAAELTTDIWHGWYDPDFCPAAQQPDAKPRIVVSIGGDLYVIDPNFPPQGDNDDQEIIRLTQVSDEYDTSVSRILQPKWWWAPASGYPDAGELKIAFVYESRTDNSSQIYVLNDVETIITTAISEGNTAPSNMVTDLSDSRITLISHKSGDPNTVINNFPKWSPSWSVGNSINGGVVSYIQDEDGNFDNAVFNNVNSSTAVNDALSTANFNTYMTNWDDPTLPDDNNDVNFVPQIIANNPYNEAFMNWAPAGGDKITYISKIGDTYTLSILPIQTNSEIGPTGGILFDNSFTEVDVPADALMGNTQLSVSPPSSIPEVTDDKMVETGEVREFYADNAGITFEKPVTMIIHYSDVDQDGIVDGTTIYEDDLKIWYYNSTSSPAQWELIGGEIDPVANTLTIQVDHFSTYGLFGTKIEKAYTLKDVRIYPNPTLYKDNKNIIFDQLPTDLEKVTIYNIAGEKVIDFDSSNIESITEPVTTTGIKWDLNNSDDNLIASGIYILVIKTKTDSKWYKFAVIK